MPRKASLYIYALALTAASLLYLFGRQIQPGQWPILLGLSMVTVIFNLWRVESPSGQSVTFNGAVDIAAILIGGPALGVWVAGLGQFVSWMVLVGDNRRVLFNTAQIVVSVSAAGVAFQLIGGAPGLSTASLIAASIAAVAYFIFNSLLMATLFGLLKGQPVLSIWLDMVKEGTESYIVVQILGLAATFLVVRGGTGWALVLLLLLVMLQRVLTRYYAALRRNTEAARHQAVQDSLLRSMVTALDARDIYTSGHSARVARYVDLIAHQLQVSETQVDELKYASLLHDVGKLGIPDSVLRKDGPLSPAERALMMEHPDRGIAILGQMSNIPRAVLDAVKHHHEWENGGGYPDGLRGDEIPLGARIIAVADAFDAMTSARPYRAGMPKSEAVHRLRQGRGTQFHAQVVDAFLAVCESQPSAIEEIAQVGNPHISELERRVEAERTSATGEPGVILPVHSKEVRVLYRLAQERRSLLDLSQTLHRTLEILYDAIGPHVFYVVLVDKNSGDAVVRATSGAHEEVSGVLWTAQTPHWRSFVGATEPAVLSARRGLPQRCVGSRTRSMIMVPLLTDNIVIGALCMESYREAAFGQDEVYLLTAVARQLADAVEVARTHELMSYAATHDGLTGVLNRTTFYTRLVEEIQAAHQRGAPLALAILDINGFKRINDTCGHLTGDGVVKAFARHLCESLSPKAIIARYGGDEFAVILPDATLRQAEAQVAAIASFCGQTGDPQTAHLSLLTASWGVSTYPEDGEKAEELVAAADQRMYDQKRTCECGAMTPVNIPAVSV